MNPSAPALPDLQTLATGLQRLVAGNGSGGQLTILGRKAFINESTYATEVVACRLVDGRILQVLCKYATKVWGKPGEESWGSRRGVLHEAAVYREVLQPMRARVPHFYGTHMGTGPGTTWMVLEYLDQSVRVNKVDGPQAMTLAAGWIGRFHAQAEARLRIMAFPFLTTYDGEFFLGWVQRTLEYAGHWHARFPWLRRLAGRFDEWVPLLLARPTIIHGEFYAKNVLFCEGEVYPVDWESAAIGAGESDLAALVEGWPAEAVARCEEEYRRARWPNGAPADFARALDAAHLLNTFRWLGDEPEMTRDRSMRTYFFQMRAAARRLGLIEG